MKRKALFLFFALCLVGGVAYASKDETVRTVSPSPLFAKSLTRSVAKMDGRLKRNQSLRPVATFVQETYDESCQPQTVAGPTCDWTICPAGCAIGSQGLVTCEGSIRCSTPTQNGGATCDGFPSCTNTVSYTCTGSGCGSATSGVTCGATVCDNTCSTTCSGGPGCTNQTIAGSTCAWEPTCGSWDCQSTSAFQPSCDPQGCETSGPQFTCGGICETSFGDNTCAPILTCDSSCGG